jgi:hypothetical protein
MLVLFGGNKYGPGMGNARLRGCDADLWTVYRYWQQNDFVQGVQCATLGDESNIAANVRKALTEAIKICDREPARVHPSSHGTWLKNNGALVNYDSSWYDDESFVRADHMNAIFKTAPAGGRIFLSIDACTFGDSVTVRALAADRQSRFIQPDLGTLIQNDHAAFVSAANPSPFVEVDFRDMPHVACISGCLRGPQYTCADVTDAQGNSYGAFTHVMHQVIRKGMTAREITDAVNKEFARTGEEQRAVCSGGLVDVPWMSMK